MSDTRENILNRLRANRGVSNTAPPPLYLPDHGWSKEEKIRRLTERMQAVRTEVHHLPDGQWQIWLNGELPQRNLTKILVGTSDIGSQFADAASDALNVQQYESDIEQWKPELFDSIDVGITSTLGGIAESGSLFLWPDQREPRLMSLAPPVHIALLDADAIYETFAQAIQAQEWTSRMPTNALLISGPSKTADIEQTLAYGIHGPKQLIVLILG